MSLMDDFLLDDEGRLRHGFTSADELEHIVGDNDKSMPTFISLS
jgi:hypothetical protein